MIFTKHSILDVWQGFEYTSVFNASVLVSLIFLINESFTVMSKKKSC